MDRRARSLATLHRENASARVACDDRVREERIPPGAWAVLVLLTVSVRATYVLLAAPRALPFSDALVYHLQANQIAHGKWFLDPLALFFRGQHVPSAAHPPLYPLALSLASRIGASSVRAHELVGCAIGVGTVVGITLLTHQLCSKRAALIL